MRWPLACGLVNAPAFASLSSVPIGIGTNFICTRTKLIHLSRCGADAIYPASRPTYSPESFYAFLIAGTAIPAILKFTEPRKFQLVK